MTVEIQKLAPPETGRVETGVVQFGEDWPGVFIRGDNAFHFWSWLKPLVNRDSGFLSAAILTGLLRLLRSCDVRVQAMEQPLPDLVDTRPPINRDKFAWVIEKLCDEPAPPEFIDAWLGLEDDGSDLQHWVSASVAIDIRAIDVIEAAEGIARGVDL